MNLLREIFCGEENFSRRIVRLHAALIPVSVAFVLMFSYSTSPLYNLLGGDSSIFQVVGKYWSQGYLPYVNVFDHKGPLIFFVNMLGYMIHPRTGVAVIQIIALYVSLMFVWRAMSLYSASTAAKIFFMAFALIYHAAHCEEGNHVTEYTLPFLSASAYCFLRTLKNSADGKFYCPPIVGAVYGVGFGACVLIRTSDAAQICCEIFLTAIFLLQARDFRTLRQNFLSGVAGFAAIVAPFALYFAAHGIFYDALYGTILLNLNYAEHAQIVVTPAIRLLHAAIHHTPLFVMMFVAVVALKKFSSRLLWSGLFIAAAMLLMFLKLRPADNYAMIFLAVAPILFAVLCESSDVLQKIWCAPKVSSVRLGMKVAGIFVVIHVCIMATFVKSVLLAEDSAAEIFFTAYSKRAELLNVNERENILRLRDMIPEAERSSFACWAGFCSGSHWILRADMLPRERFFMNNGLLAKMDPNVRAEFFGNVRRDYPLWIIYGVSPDRNFDEPPKFLDEDVELERLLAERYTLRGEVYIWPQLMKLYRLKSAQ